MEWFTWGIAAEFGEYNIAVNAIKSVKVVDTEGTRFWQKEAINHSGRHRGKWSSVLFF